ncbi:MAG TPA: DcaP family trimeric outer membrane transporter [Stellaceae bacterium]|nr:DcaP family trimeric outer membrane transporter [Stellaceae bacterium]
MKHGRHLAITAAVAGAFALPLAIGPQAARADELSDLRANQELLQRRLDQLAQGIPAPGAPYPGGPVAKTAGAALVGGSFPRSFVIPGTDTSIRVGGEIRLLADYIFNGGNPNRGTPFNSTLGNNGQIPAIPLNGSAARRTSRAIFGMTPRESKVNFETRTPTAYGEARTFMEFDWAGSTAFAPGGADPTSVSDSLHPRLRYAYGTLGGILGGQANSNFSDSDASAETIDFGGNFGSAGVVRLAQLRYTMPLAPWGYPGALSVSAESPETDIVTGAGIIADDASGADPAGDRPSGTINPTKTPAPDLTLAWYVPQPWGHFDFSAVVRPTLQIKDNAFVDRTFTGWGIHFSGDVKPLWFGWAKDNITWQFVYGDGIGRYLNSSTNFSVVSNYPATHLASAAEAAALRAKTTVEWGGQVGYQHFWAPNLRSSVSAGFNHHDIPSLIISDSQRGSLNKELISVHANLIWAPVPFVDFGLEYLWGHRRVVNNEHGDMNALISRMRVRF